MKRTFKTVILLIAFSPGVLHAQENSAQWKCEAEAPCIVDAALTCDGVLVVYGEGPGRAGAEAKAMANCQKANGKREKTGAKCQIGLCHPLSYIGKSRCKDDSECNIDLDSGRCDTDVPSLIVDESRAHPLCACYKADHLCHMKWVDYRACDTDDDCWSSGNQPVARPKALRGYKFRGCEDGESEPKCIDKLCVVQKLGC